MRLIDADKLHEEIYEQTKFKRDPATGDYVSMRAMRISEILRRIDNQPTVGIEDIYEIVPVKIVELKEQEHE